MQYCVDRALLSNLDQLKRGAKLDVIKYINNVCLKVYETAQIKADVNLEHSGSVEVKVKTLADIRKAKSGS